MPGGRRGEMRDPAYREDTPPGGRRGDLPARGRREALAPSHRDRPSAAGRARGRSPLSTAEQGRRARRWWPVLLPLTLVAILASVLLPAGRHEWALSLTKQPTPYTALSFQRPWTLPATDPFGRPIPVSFEISNQQGQPTRYQYVLAQSDGVVTSTLGGAARTIPAGATWTVSTVVRPTCPGSVCHIEVSLPGHPEVIDFVVHLFPAAPQSDGKQR
jgi:hypothetical protein